MEVANSDGCFEDDEGWMIEIPNGMVRRGKVWFRQCERTDEVGQT